MGMVLSILLKQGFKQKYDDDDDDDDDGGGGV